MKSSWVVKKPDTTSARRMPGLLCAGLADIACQEGHHDSVQLLLEAEADVDHARSKEGATALYIASQNGHSRCVEAMLDADVSIDLPMHDGSTCVPATGDACAIEAYQLGCLCGYLP